MLIYQYQLPSCSALCGPFHTFLCDPGRFNYLYSSAGGWCEFSAVVFDAVWGWIGRCKWFGIGDGEESEWGGVEWAACSVFGWWVIIPERDGGGPCHKPRTLVNELMHAAGP